MGYLLDYPVDIDDITVTDVVTLLNRLQDYHLRKRNDEIIPQLQKVCDSCDRLTTGNVSHDKYYIKRSINNIIESIKSKDNNYGKHV